MRKRVSALVLSVAVAALVAAPNVRADDHHDDLVFVDVTVLDGLGGAPRSGSVAVSGGTLRLGQGEGRRVDVEGAYLAPGFVEASGRTMYLRGEAEITREMTADVDAADLVDPRHSEFREAAFEGCTTVVVPPGPRNVVGGLTAAFHAWSPEGRAVRIADAPQALHAAFGRSPSTGNFPPRFGATTSIYARRPTTRMGVVWMLRQAFLAAKGVQPAPDDADLAHYREVIDGDRTLRLHARTIQDLNGALRLAEEVGLQFVLEGAEEGYVVRDALGKRQTPVLVGPLPDIRSGRGADFTSTALNNAAMLRDAGCTVALVAGDSGARWLREQAMFATRYGFSREEALAAVTSVPADLCGLKDRGRIENGAAADIVLWSGHPLLPSSRMLMVVIDGRVVFDRTREEK
jgi:imidazolonepropionase-like amidohydrolase